MSTRYSRWSWHVALKAACLRIVYTCIALMVLVYWLSEVVV